ncbi:hypothetical protein BGZ65_007306 [Modicella reniformis]|uniref:Uncharacterized protein n=1 Tax=Modicella reniformis TaxID=1440133 RepID=A0A9P6LRY0_9FUNG|nr:hypothetical protein BGZ65_007306 [Modicella reniformis]
MLEDFLGHIAIIYITPSQGNPFEYNSGLLPLDTPFPYDFNSNFHTVTQGDTSIRINVVPETKKVIRKGFFGFFGLFEKNLKHEITTSGNTFTMPYSNYSILDVFMNKYFLDQTEIP